MESMKSIECPPSELPIVDRGSCDGGLDYQQCMEFLDLRGAQSGVLHPR